MVRVPGLPKGEDRLKSSKHPYSSHGGLPRTTDRHLVDGSENPPLLVGYLLPLHQHGRAPPPHVPQQFVTNPAQSASTALALPMNNSSGGCSVVSLPTATFSACA